MKTLGIHLIVDGWNCPPEVLDDPKIVERALVAAVHAGGATLIHSTVHQFSPQGVTATATLAESHIAIHTWPEHGYFGADMFFCGSGNAHAAVEPIRRLLQAGQLHTTELRRGIEPGGEPPVRDDG